VVGAAVGGGRSASRLAVPVVARRSRLAGLSIVLRQRNLSGTGQLPRREPARELSPSGLGLVFWDKKRILDFALGNPKSIANAAG
jgi:hypothetical protein